MEQAVGGFRGIFEDHVLARRRVIPLTRLCHMQQACGKMEIGGVWPIVGCVWCGTSSTPCASANAAQRNMPVQPPILMISGASPLKTGF
jgi:hypothetical protein